jgi:enamine deaminase RidA (YjgF/YER057c/UK114 family)
MMKILQPPGWARPKGFSHGIAVKGGTAVYVAGQVDLSSPGFAAQFRGAMKSVLAVLAEAGGRPEHLVRLTWYVIDREEYLAALREVGAAYRELMGRHYPVMAVVQVSGLVEEKARLEIEATAVVPD